MHEAIPDFSYPLKTMNTLGLDVRARYFFQPSTVDDVLAWVNSRAPAPYLILGEGSNTVFLTDWAGWVIHPRFLGIEVISHEAQTVILEVGAGERWDDVVSYCVAHGYAGIENLSLIPGQAGAAPIQNIGAYGVELSHVFDSLHAVHLETGEEKVFKKEACAFSYRDSFFKSSEGHAWLITSLRLRLNQAQGAQLKWDYPALKQYFKEHNSMPTSVAHLRHAVCEIRRAKLPDPSLLGNVGSFFKNPQVPIEQWQALKRQCPGMVGFVQSDQATVKLAAGWLIEACGLKGQRTGAVGVHEKQALVLVNYGGATGAAVWAFAKEIQQGVLAKFGVLLEVEPRIVTSEKTACL